MDNKVLIVIAGPTAIGKTSLAIELAQYFNTEIISADSRQFFREMSIGTAKPNEFELSEAKHHFINSHSIFDEVSVGSYEKEALTLLSELFQSKDIIIMVGGSGLYINAVLNGFDELPEVNADIRTELNQRLEKEGILVLQEELKSVDPTYYSQVDIQNPQRIIRALEIYHSVGKPFSSFRTGERKTRPFKSILIGLNTSRDLLYDRINQRVDSMINNGLLKEVSNLTPQKELNSLNTVGYTEIFKFLNNEFSLEIAIELIKQNSRRFAKRQITWFKKLKGLKWFDPKDKKEIISYIKEEIISLNNKNT